MLISRCCSRRDYNIILLVDPFSLSLLKAWSLHETRVLFIYFFSNPKKLGISKVWFRIFSKTVISILSIDSMASSRRMLLKVIILCDSRWVFKSLIWLVCLLVLSLIGEYLGRESGRNFCVFFIMLDWFGFVNNEVFFLMLFIIIVIIIIFSWTWIFPRNHFFFRSILENKSIFFFVMENTNRFTFF